MTTASNSHSHSVRVAGKTYATTIINHSHAEDHASLVARLDDLEARVTALEAPEPPPPPPPPSGTIPVPSSIKADGSVDVTAALRDFIVANAGSPVELAAGGRYRCDGQLDFRNVTGIWIVSDPANRATIWGAGYHPVTYFKGCVATTVESIIIEGSAPNPGVTDKVHEYGHGVHLDGGQNYTFDRVLIRNVEGDGFYCAQDGTIPGSGLYVNDVRIEGISRMGFGVVAWETIRALNTEYHNIAWSPIDLEPDPNVYYVQKANDCIFDGGTITGWVGNWASGGLQYRVPFYLGTPSSNPSANQPQCERNKILRHHVASSVRAGLACRIDPLGTSVTRDFEFAFNTADGPHSPLDGVGFVAAVNAQNVNVHDNRMDLTSQGWAVGDNGGSSGLTASGNSGANLIGQVKP